MPPSLPRAYHHASLREGQAWGVIQGSYGRGAVVLARARRCLVGADILYVVSSPRSGRSRRLGGLARDMLRREVGVARGVRHPLPSRQLNAAGAIVPDQKDQSPA